jgi:hypothetical protein
MTHAVINPWTRSHHDAEAFSQIWHARRCSRWLLRAGAEPRLSLLLSSGESARARWTVFLEEQGVIVHRCRVTAERPLPAPLTAHRGDHFNRTLFHLEGLDELSLDEPDRAREVFRTLDGQRSQLRQLATWVALSVEHPYTLSLMYEHAPQLMDLVQQRCWMWAPQERTRPTARVHLPPQAKPVETLFAEASAFDHPPSALTFSRWVRSGYPAPPPSASETWASFYRVWRGDLDSEDSKEMTEDRELTELGGRLDAVASHLALTHRQDLLTAERRGALIENCRSAGLSWASPLEPSLPIDELSEGPWGALGQMIHQDLPPSSDLLASAELAWPTLSPSSSGYIGKLMATGYAWREDIEGCLRVLNALSQSETAWPESRFFADERLAELYTLLHDRGAGQAAIDRLFLSLDTLLSPLYEVRSINAKAHFLGAIDDSRGRRERDEARRLSLIHGIDAPQAD